MKNLNFSIFLIFLFFNITLCSNLFFQWRITDVEKEQLDRELFELFKTNSELYNKFVSNYKTKSDNQDEPVLRLSRYTYCQKCLNFVKSFKVIKDKYGFDALINNVKKTVCPMLSSKLDEDVCHGFADKYGHVIFDSFFSKFFSGYFFCERVDLCPNEIPKNYVNSDKYAERLLSQKKPREKEKPSGEVLRMMQITDLHVDDQYAPNCSATCLKPICCRENSTPSKKEPLSGKYGYEGSCDVPMELFQSFVEDASKRNVDFIIWTGDNAPHDSWNNTQKHAYEIAEKIKFELDKGFNNENTKTPVFYSLGNHEKYPNDDFKDDEGDMLERMSNIFKSYLDDDSVTTFKEGGYYSKKFGDTKLRIIALNCLVCDCFNFNLFNSSQHYTKKMFKWLEAELQKAENNGEYVYILNHFPLNGEFTLTECAKRFQALFDRYEYTIRGIFSGHTHYDDVEGISAYFDPSKIIHLNFIAPQLTTYSHKLPSYRIYIIDKETFEVLNYEQYRFDLDKSNKEVKPYWNLAYEASNFYDVENMLDYNKIVNCQNMQGYVFNKYSGSKEG
jgi:sphingomyelin phosphodiesterase